MYGGYSAGPCVLGPTIRGFEITDDPLIVPAAYGDEPVWTGMGIIDFVVVPHIGSPEHAVSVLLTQFAADYGRRITEPPACPIAGYVTVRSSSSTALTAP